MKNLSSAFVMIILFISVSCGTSKKAAAVDPHLGKLGYRCKRYADGYH